MRPRALCVGDLVLKEVEQVQKRLRASKFASKWIGPYVIREALDSCYFFFLNLIKKISWHPLMLNDRNCTR